MYIPSYKNIYIYIHYFWLSPPIKTLLLASFPPVHQPFWVHLPSSVSLPTTLKKRVQSDFDIQSTVDALHFTPFDKEATSQQVVECVLHRRPGLHVDLTNWQEKVALAHLFCQNVFPTRCSKINSFCVLSRRSLENIRLIQQSLPCLFKVSTMLNPLRQKSFCHFPRQLCVFLCFFVLKFLGRLSQL